MVDKYNFVLITVLAQKVQDFWNLVDRRDLVVKQLHVVGLIVFQFDWNQKVVLGVRVL